MQCDLYPIKKHVWGRVYPHTLQPFFAKYKKKMNLTISVKCRLGIFSNFWYYFCRIYYSSFNKIIFPPHVIKKCWKKELMSFRFQGSTKHSIKHFNEKAYQSWRSKTNTNMHFELHLISLQQKVLKLWNEKVISLLRRKV